MRRLHLEKTRAGALFHLWITVDMEPLCWESLPHAAGGVGQLPGGLLGEFQKVALLTQQQRLLGLHGRRERAAQLRVNRPIQRPGGQHKADGSKAEKDLRP